MARSARLVSKRFEALEGRVGQVILHLQVGDAFRQRLEHVESILAMAEDVGSPDAARALRILAAAQIRAALGDLDRSSRGAVKHLAALARTAADIPRAGAIGSPRSDGREGLGGLVSASGRIEAVIGRLAETTHRLTDSSRSLAETLADAGQDAGSAAEFERRMTVLGLNAILLASRLGPEGRAMEEVAQQQRQIARSIIDVMSRLRRDLEGVVAAAGDLHAGADEDLAAALQGAGSATSEVMSLSDRVRQHLGELERVRGAGELVELVEDARKEIECFAEMAASLAGVAEDLDDSLDEMDLKDGGTTSFLARARRLYSMQAERLVHDRLFPGA
ncbi:putative transducer like protein [Rubellimicrobium mesophilum DSM 19309]|uniref:Putative transducer like protein n=1 Tax=Rubellimicrobium mesophilum DSM 19309 TaxID=442562 RepID=A0A017HS45_9RHOB|nr:hypothetical protein [Rubellimicrobium mesophilum]EYD76544.1 putative transducer like protein [Rubellimicrobium mesophilum DSM 19309]